MRELWLSWRLRRRGIADLPHRLSPRSAPPTTVGGARGAEPSGIATQPDPARSDEAPFVVYVGVLAPRWCDFGKTPTSTASSPSSTTVDEGRGLRTSRSQRLQPRRATARRGCGVEALLPQRSKTCK